MLLWLFALISFGLGQASGSLVETADKAGDPASGTAQPAFVAEIQTPSGKFTTAVEVKPILTATKAQWVAVREYDGQDLVYFTQLVAWRCGLVALRYGVNGGQFTSYDLPPCQIDAAIPNALPDDHLPYVAFPLKSVGSVQVELIYDDLAKDSGNYERDSILIP